MNYNCKRHELLSILSNQLTLNELSHISEEGDFVDKQLSYSYILEKLKVSDYELNILIKELTENSEINYYLWNDDEKRGLFATSKGLTSFANKKYSKASLSIKKNNIKDFVQIVIPVLSLLATILVIYTTYKREEIKSEKQEKRIENLENQLKKVKKSVDETNRIIIDKKNFNSSQKIIKNVSDLNVVEVKSKI